MDCLSFSHEWHLKHPDLFFSPSLISVNIVTVHCATTLLFPPLVWLVLWCHFDYYLKRKPIGCKSTWLFPVEAKKKTCLFFCSPLVYCQRIWVCYQYSLWLLSWEPYSLYYYYHLFYWRGSKPFNCTFWDLLKILNLASRWQSNRLWESINFCVVLAVPLR